MNSYSYENWVPSDYNPYDNPDNYHRASAPEFRYHVVSLDNPHALIAGFQAIGDAVEYVRNAGKSDRLIKVA